MKFKKILETERLVLREFNINDAEFILKLLNTPAWKFPFNGQISTQYFHALDYLVYAYLQQC